MASDVDEDPAGTLHAWLYAMPLGLCGSVVSVDLQRVLSQAVSQSVSQPVSQHHWVPVCASRSLHPCCTASAVGIDACGPQCDTEKICMAPALEPLNDMDDTTQVERSKTFLSEPSEPSESSESFYNPDLDSLYRLRLGNIKLGMIP